MTGGSCEGAEDAQGCTGLHPMPENTAREGILPTTCPSAMAQSLSPQILIRFGQEPRECLHPGSYSWGEVPAPAGVVAGGEATWGSPHALTVLGLSGHQVSLPFCSPSARLCLHLLPPPSFLPLAFPLAERLPWCAGSLQVSSGQILLRGHLAW